MKGLTSTGQDFMQLCKQKRQASAGKMQDAFPMLEYPLPELPPTWTWASLSEICERVSVGHVGSTTPYFVKKEQGIPLIRSQDVRPGKLMLRNTAYISKEYHQKLKKSQLKAGDVLIVRVGANRGDVCVVPDDIGEINCANIVFARPMYPNKFIGYYFQNAYGRELLLSITTGSAQGVINTQTIARIPVAVPSIETQKKIASILSAYDDLLENNTRRIKILEEMAQNLYHEWFVKFRFPGHEQTKMVDSELGLIPEGWEVKQLGNIAQEIRRSVQPDAIDPETPYFGLEHLPRKSIALAEWGTAGQVQSTKLIFKKGEILFGKIRPYFHKVGVAPVNGICSSDTIVIQAKDFKYFSISLCCISSEDFVNHATQTSQGTKMPRANWDVLIKYPIVIPPSPLLEQFNEFIQNIVNQIHNLILKNRNLSKTRDLLLPKLISGEIDVEHLDINTEDIAA